jgi:type II secretory ATPase GspE/PulE/Tfp pilus assembly ATPase PilB-like protein
LQIPAGTPVFAGTGCVRCGHTGYKGRFAIYEYIIMDEDLRREMSLNPDNFAATFRKRRDMGLRINGIRNIKEGNTTASEIIRALYREIPIKREGA